MIYWIKKYWRKCVAYLSLNMLLAIIVSADICHKDPTANFMLYVLGGTFVYAIFFGIMFWAIFVLLDLID